MFVVVGFVRINFFGFWEGAFCWERVVVVPFIVIVPSLPDAVNVNGVLFTNIVPVFWAIMMGG